MSDLSMAKAFVVQTVRRRGIELQAQAASDLEAVAQDYDPQLAERATRRLMLSLALAVIADEAEAEPASLDLIAKVHRALMALGGEA